MTLSTLGNADVRMRASSRTGGQEHGGRSADGRRSGEPARHNPGPPGDGASRSIDDIKAALASVPEELGRLLEGRGREELTQPANDGGWGIVEILPHFRDWEAVIRERVERILAENAPALDEHDDSLWAIEHDYSSQDPHTVLAAFRAQRLNLAARIEPLDVAAWERTASLPKHGTITLRWLLNNVCDHDARHLVEVRDVLA